MGDDHALAGHAVTNAQLSAMLQQLANDTPMPIVKDWLADQGVACDLSPLDRFPTAFAARFWIMTNFPSEGQLLKR